jgi:hypothetical protein
MKDMCTPEMIEKYNLGPCGMMTVMPTGVPKMGKSLILWFLYSVILSIFVAYITRLTVVPGESYLRVFRIAGTVAVVGYAVSYIPDSIWKGQSWSSTFKFIFDGVIYGLVTAGTFGWLWPDAM